ncbi:MAG: DJ-1/PfpI family protein [Bacteroides sp.]|jgi:transcriptional regulator GlxA family with amidase domain|nr:DJ-1/PfpI family protein [Bacteroides sp.]
MRTIGILLFDDVELLDFAGPYEVFSVANELNDFKLFNISTISETGQAIKSVHGMKVLPDYSIQNCPAIDILVIPGGEGTKNVIGNLPLMDWMQSTCERSEITFSVCSGARVLAKLGLLDNQEFATHQLVVDDVLRIASGAIANREKRFIDNGGIMTSAGISAGIDLALYVVEKLHGRLVKENTTAYMEYDCQG